MRKEDKIKELEKKLTGNIMNDAAIRDEIAELKGRKTNTDEQFDCVGCGS